MFVSFIVSYFVLAEINVWNEPKKPLKKEILFEERILKFASIQDTTRNLESVMRTSKPYRIVSLLNASCSDCIRELESWKVILEELDRDKFEIVFIAYDTHLEMVKYNVKTLAQFPEHVFHDQDAIFMRVNSIERETPYKTFLVDDKLHVLVEGNPAKHKQVLKQYLSILSN